jgi:tetratricopeptide (TPR) repeat protein
MIGVSRRDLDYWTRLRLVLPRSRWGERFFSFSDLVALETIKRLTARNIPARLILRAITALEIELGQARTPLSMLQISTNGRQVVVHPPTADDGPFEPLTGQFVLRFETSELDRKVRAMPSRTAEEWFDMAMALDSNAESLEQAAEAYQKTIEAAPEWVEAHINFGATLYQLNRMEEAREEFKMAVAFEPQNAIAEFNLACVLQQLGQVDEAIDHLQRTIALSPTMTDAHFNLALAYEKRGQIEASIRHLSLYLRFEPQGTWAEFARLRVAEHINPGHTPASGKVMPFPRNR